MSGLSQGLQQLVNAERFASRPTFADRERVLRRIQAQLGIAVGISGIAVSASLAGGSFRPHVWSGTTKALAGLGLIVAAIALVYSAVPGASTINDAAAGDPDADTKASAGLDAVATTNQQDPGIVCPRARDGSRLVVAQAAAEVPARWAY